MLLLSIFCVMGPKPESLESIKASLLAKYGDTFILDEQFVYVNAVTPVKLLCKKNPEHGYYESQPYVLLRKVRSPLGCPTCKKEQDLTFFKLRFIETCTKLYGDKYDYSKVAYVNNRTKVEIKCRKDHTFMMTPDNHTSGHECPFCCSHRHSKGQLEWLNYVMKVENINIQHYENQGEYMIESVGKVDGYCEATNTVYEYHGCWWHGCTECFTKRNEVHHWVKKTYQQLYLDTTARDARIRQLGYNLVIVWEHEWKARKLSSLIVK